MSYGENNDGKVVGWLLAGMIVLAVGVVVFFVASIVEIIGD